MTDDQTTPTSETIATGCPSCALLAMQVQALERLVLAMTQGISAVPMVWSMDPTTQADIRSTIVRLKTEHPDI